MIVPMKHISLFALKDDEKRIMKTLQRNGIVQVTKQSDPTTDDAALKAASELYKRSCETELTEASANVSRIKSCLGRLTVYLPKEGMLAAAPEYPDEELVSSVPGALSVCDELDALTKKAATLRTEKERTAAALKQLAPFRAMDVPLETIKSTRSADFLLGTMKADRAERLKDSGVMADSFGAGQRVAVLAAVPKKDPEETLAALKELGFNEASLPGYEGLAEDNYERLEEKLESIALESAENSKSIAALAENAATLKKGLDGALIEESSKKAKCSLFATRETFSLEGWVRSDEEEKLKALLSGVTETYCLETRDPFDDELPPTYCKNNKFFAPFEFITNMYSPPDPRGFDPTVVMTPFYLLFFGLMMGDTGYGIVMSLAAFLFLKIKKPTGGTAQVAQILVWGGLSTAIFGLLAGTFFGMNWYDLFGESFPFPLLDPMKDQMTAILVYCGLGFLQIIAGMIVSIVLHIKKGDWQTALFDIGSWLMIFAGAGLVFGLSGWAKYLGFALAGIGLILLVGFGGRAKKGIGRVIGGLGKLYDITGFFSDVLSYSRVFALGLATGAMGYAFNLVVSIVKDMLKGIPVVGGVVSFIVAAILLALLHAFCIAINALGAFIHCARLQFIEYYNRFYTPGGKLFAPLGIKTKYNKVK